MIASGNEPLRFAAQEWAWLDCWVRQIQERPARETRVRAPARRARCERKRIRGTGEARQFCGDRSRSEPARKVEETIPGRWYPIAGPPSSRAGDACAAQTTPMALWSPPVPLAGVLVIGSAFLSRASPLSVPVADSPKKLSVVRLRATASRIRRSPCHIRISPQSFCATKRPQIHQCVKSGETRIQP